MKKIFTLVAATLLTVASFAADRPPVVTLQNNRNYEVMIDGRRYSGYGIQQINLRRGQQHQIKVFEVSRGGFGLFGMRSRRLVDATTFSLGRNDMDISIDFRGQIRINEDRYGDRDHRWNDHRNNDWDGHDGYGQNRDYHDNR
jgi:hypothetical protein